MSQQSKDKQKAVFATVEDIDRAVDALTSADQRRLEKFAQYRIRGLGRRASGYTHEDLLSEAVMATILGAQDATKGRHWRMDQVPFVPFLIGAMRSISSHLKEAFDENEPLLDCEASVETEEGQLLSAVENAPSRQPLQDRDAAAREELGRVHRIFQDDDDAALIIEGFKEGMSGPEIIEQLGIPKNQYEAGLKRIRYKLK